uniref:Uncharacterized protein n=2 Tax=Physcomitrium patens TaxID=3218 RepID=A0A2K1IE83_PHYPA|nr:hypothetical protein PHYPA_029743 [Physcomitrium patens]
MSSNAATAISTNRLCGTRILVMCGTQFVQDQWCTDSDGETSDRLWCLILHNWVLMLYKKSIFLMYNLVTTHLWNVVANPRNGTTSQWWNASQAWNTSRVEYYTT